MHDVRLTVSELSLRHHCLLNERSMDIRQIMSAAFPGMRSENIPTILELRDLQLMLLGLGHFERAPAYYRPFLDDWHTERDR